MSDERIYFDYAATTPVDPLVFAAMQPYFLESFGNPASVHLYGQKAEAAVETARETVARLLNCRPSEIYFTSGATESNNLALRGAALAARQEKGANHILISPVEHPAVAKTAAQLAQVFGFEMETLPVDEYGRVGLKELEKRLRPETAIVSAIYANNEIGTINAIEEIGSLCRERGITFHTDAVQAAAYLPLDVTALHVDMLSLGAHKFYGPKGVGALFGREGAPLIPTQTGGGQEGGIRSGTLNVPLIVGLAEALKIAREERDERSKDLRGLRDHLIDATLQNIPDARITGHPTERLPNHASFAFRGVDGNSLLAMLDVAGFACSSGSACKTGDPEPSDILLALGLEPDWALGSLRVTLGRYTTPEHIEKLSAILPEMVERARALEKV